MLLLTSDTDKLQVVTGSAVTVDVHASWVDNDAGAITPGRTNTAIAAAATTDVVAPPAATAQRNVQTLNIRNKHASSSNVVTVKHTDGVTGVELIAYTLLAGEQMQYVDGEGWKVIDANGQVLSGPPITSGGTPGLVPVGGVINWSGTIAAIAALAPTWQFCDGTANAPGPDLRDKFVVGAKQDDVGVAKTNIRGSLEQSATATGHSHSGHADLTHAGMTIGDHTGLTHGLTIANHPDLTHAALSHAASTFTIPDHSLPSQSHTHGGMTHADISQASFSGTHASQTFSVPSGTHSHASTAGVSSFATSTNRSGIVSNASFSGTHASATGTVASGTHSHAASSLPIVSHPSFSGTDAAQTVTHGAISFPSLSHQDIGTHKGTDYGVHTFTPPAAHGAAGTLVHSFSEPDDHVISAHDVVSMVPSFFALAFIQRMV